MTKMFGSDMKSLLVEIASRATISVTMLTHVLLIDPQPTETSVIGFRIIHRFSMSMRLDILLNDVEVLGLSVHGYASDCHGFLKAPSQSRSNADDGASVHDRSICKANDILV